MSRVYMPEAERCYEEFKQAARRELKAAIEETERNRNFAQQRLLDAKKTLHEMPAVIAKYDADLANLRSLSAPDHAPLIFAFPDGDRVLGSVRNAEPDIMPPAPLTGTPENVGRKE